MWTWRLDAGPLSDADSCSAYEAWQRQDPRHRRAMEEFSKVWLALDGLAEAKRDEKIATFTDVQRRSSTQHPAAVVVRGGCQHSAGNRCGPLAAPGQ